jgi:rhamnogalacturonan endolyase
MSDGTTRSKHYSNHRLIDWLYTGATGQNVGVFMVRSNHEGDSGGPFYRCLINQCGADQEIYEIINYGEVQTEAFRTSILNGPYTLVFTNGSQPTLPLDTSWLSNLDLLGYVPQWNRNYVKGKANGIPNGFQGVVGFANSKAQYWCTVSNSNYWSPWMIPGIYTETLYKGELAVATQSVAVPASETPVIQNIASAEFSPVYIWRIGQWDGTPSGFLNADKVTTMHPSDVRMASWKPVTYTVGSSSDSSFPCYQWKYVNNPTTIKFNLSSNQVTAHTLRIGITTAYAGGRPRVSVNSWTSSRPSTSIPQPHTRSLTIGSYRGNNTTFTYAIPASAFVAGTNTLMINVISISENTGYLSAGYAYDCVELDN